MAQATSSPARLAFRGAPAHVRVPATSANLGAGFDALGIALGLHDDVVARIGDDGVRVDVAGEGERDVPRDESHLVVQAMRAAFERMGEQPRGIELSCANRIPHGRGLGSSSAAICAGIVLARALVLGGDRLLPDEQALSLASAMEGHPDNVAACLLGGLTIAWTEAGPAAGSSAAGHPAGAEAREGAGSSAARAVRLDPAAGIGAAVLIPESTASTHAVRGLLPADVPFADAAHNAGRAALAIAALLGRPDALLAATEDRLHQPYRASAMPESAQLVARLRAAGIPAMISGAGPTVIVLTDDAGSLAAALAAAPAGWRALSLPVERSGARIVKDS